MIHEKEYEQILKGNLQNKPVFRHLFERYGASATSVPAESSSESERSQHLELHTESVETMEVSVNDALQSSKAVNGTVEMVGIENINVETHTKSIEPLIAQEHLKNDKIHDPTETSNDNNNKEVEVKEKKGVNALKMEYELNLKRHYLNKKNTVGDHTLISIRSRKNGFEKEINVENKDKSVIEDLALKKEANDSIEGENLKEEMASTKVEESEKDKNFVKLEKKIENLYNKIKRNCDNLKKDQKDEKVVNCIYSKIETKVYSNEGNETIVAQVNDSNNDVNVEDTSKAFEDENNQSDSLIIQDPEEKIEEQQTPTFKSLFDFWEKIANSSN